MSDAEAITFRGRTVGRACGGVFVRRCEAARSKLMRPPAWALHTEILNELRRRGATTIIIEAVDEGRRYIAPLAAFDAHGFRLDRGIGQQVALHEKHWSVEAMTDPLPLGEGLPAQAGLFEEVRHD